MDLSLILTPQAVIPGVNVASKKRLFLEIGDTAERIYGLDTEEVYKALMAREELGPTGMGRGVAIPHARLKSLDKVVGLFMTLEKPVEFEAVDRKPVTLVFVLLAPSEAGAEHLKALARVSRLLRDEGMCKKLRANDDAAALYAMIAGDERSKAA